MGMANAIRQQSLPDSNDLDGWKARVAQLERELESAKGMVASLEEVKPVDDDDNDDDDN